MTNNPKMNLNEGSHVATFPLPSLKQVLSDYTLSAKKSLGQNFILDTNLLDKIVKSAKSKDPLSFEKGTVIEIGCGPAGLTRAILENGARKLIGVEKDERCLEILKQVQAAYPNRFEMINKDALRVDVNQLGSAPRAVIANLPYNVGTKMLTSWLEKIEAFSSLTLMFQKEVAERLRAQPKTKNYGRLSILIQRLCHVEILFDVNPSCFVPAPKVMSCLVHLTPRKQPLALANKEILEKLTFTAFNKRRKMLRSSLKAFGDVEKLCEAGGVLSSMRAEEVSIEAFCAMARFLEN